MSPVLILFYLSTFKKKIKCLLNPSPPHIHYNKYGIAGMKILVHLCMSHVLLCNKIPQSLVIWNNSHHLAISVHLEFRHSLGGVLWLEVSQGTAINMLVGPLLSQGWTGEGSAFKLAQWLLAGFRPSQVVRLGISVPCWLMARSHPQFLATRTSPWGNPQLSS